MRNVKILLFVSAVIITIINISWQGCLVLANYSPSISSLNDDLQSDSFTLDAINGTHDFRLNFFKDQFRRPWRTGGHREPDTTQCVRPAKCEKLQNATCFGIKIPYRSTSSLLTESEQIRIFEALRNIPKCWAVVQVCVIVFLPQKISLLNKIVFFNFICSHFCVRFLCQNVKKSRIVIWYFYHHMICAVLQWNHAVYYIIQHSFQAI